MSYFQPFRGSRGGLPGHFAVLVVAAATLSAVADEPNKRHYSLASTPLEIHARLAELNMGPAVRLADDEQQLLATIWERKSKNPAASITVDEGLLLDAVLFASGIEEREVRNAYREKFNAVLAGARKAVKGATDQRQRGETLLRFLHEGVMNKGYESGPSSFAAIFDTGKYNCVSSTAMYYLIGSRLGLELRPLAIPGSAVLAGHASLDMVDNEKLIQIEPTNPDGFDWQVKINRPGVIVLGFVPDRKDGHAIDAPGIAAMIYSNRGVALSGEKPPKHLGAVRCYLAALALDPADETACNNLQSVFVNWGPELIGEKKFEEAVRVLAFGLTIAPKSDAMRNNYRIAWSAHIEAALRAGRDKDALMLIDRAAKAVTDDADFQSASHWFVRHAEALIKDKSWDAGLAVADRGARLLPEDEVKKLLEWRSNVYRRWSQSLLEKGEVDESAKVLARAFAQNSEDKEIIAGIAFHTRETLLIADRKSGPAGTIEQFKAIRQQFPNLDDVNDGGARHVSIVVEKLAGEMKFKEAVTAVDEYGPLLTKPDARVEVGSDAYDRWARSLAGDKEWKAALDKYAEGLKVFPQHERLIGNGIATVDEWASAAINAKTWDEAIRIYTLGLKYFPDNQHLRDNKAYCEERQKKG
jgi:tetratricopeptide (TPR) repeat protein